MTRRPRADLSTATVAEARRLVMDKGAAGLNARDLAAAVGVSVGTIYNLFPSLDDVLLQVNGETLGRLLEGIGDADRRAAAAGGGPDERLLAQACAYLDFARTHLRLYQALMHGRNPVLEQDPPDWFLEKIAALRRTVEDAIAPLFPAEDPSGRERAAAAIWAATNGLVDAIVSAKLRTVTKATGERMVEDLIAILVAGLRKRHG